LEGSNIKNRLGQTEQRQVLKKKDVETAFSERTETATNEGIGHKGLGGTIGLGGRMGIVGSKQREIRNSREARRKWSGHCKPGRESEGAVTVN